MILVHLRWLVRGSYCIYFVARKHIMGMEGTGVHYENLKTIYRHHKVIVWHMKNTSWNPLGERSQHASDRSSERLPGQARTTPPVLARATRQTRRLPCISPYHLCALSLLSLQTSLHSLLPSHFRFEYPSVHTVFYPGALQMEHHHLNRPGALNTCSRSERHWHCSASAT